MLAFLRNNKNIMGKIAEIPERDRPREKLLRDGPGRLSDAELLAVFLRTGSRGVSAIELAQRLLNRFGGLGGLLKAPQQAFVREPGLGPAKFASLSAVLEMAKRHMDALHLDQPFFSNPQASRNWLRHRFAGLGYEVFSVVFLNQQHQVICCRELFRGSVSSANVPPREVLRETMQQNAAALVLCHNHPSGSLKPSPDDIALTRTLTKLMHMIDVRVLDHIIVSTRGTLSLAEQGLMSSV